MIRRLTSNICHHTSHIRRLTSVIRPLISYLCHQTSVVRHLSSDIRCLTSDSVTKDLSLDVCYQTVWCLMFVVWWQTSDVCLMSGIWWHQNTWDVTSDVWHAYDVWCRTSDICLICDLCIIFVWCWTLDVPSGVCWQTFYVRHLMSDVCLRSDFWCTSDARCYDTSDVPEVSHVRSQTSDL